MWRSVWVCGVVLGTAGCVSSSTWSSYGELERELGEEREVASAPRPRAALTDCDAIANTIVQRFPTLRAGRDRARAALARGRSEAALPAPEAMLEVWDFPIGDPEQADRQGMYMAGVSQALPPAASLDGRARASAEEARAALAEVSDTARALRVRAIESCVEWSAAELEAQRLGDAQAIAERMREVLLARVRAGGSTSVADLARVDGELARLRRMRVELAARSERSAARLNAWLGRDGSDRLATAPAIELPSRVDDVERFVARAIESRGALRAARARARAAGARADSARAQASIPTFMIRATYMQMPGARAGLGAAIGMTLPWLWSGEGAAADAAHAEEDAALEEVAAMELEVGADVRAAAVEVRATLRTLAELREHERPAAERALEALGAGVPTGSVELSAWLDAARTLRDLELEEARLIAAAARAWAELESAVGEPLAMEGSR